MKVSKIKNRMGTGDMNDWKGKKFYKYVKPTLHISGQNEGIIDSHHAPCSFDEALEIAINGKKLINSIDKMRSK